MAPGLRSFRTLDADVAVEELTVGRTLPSRQADPASVVLARVVASVAGILRNAVDRTVRSVVSWSARDCRRIGEHSLALQPGERETTAAAVEAVCGVSTNAAVQTGHLSARHVLSNLTVQPSVAEIHR